MFDKIKALWYNGEPKQDEPDWDGMETRLNDTARKIDDAIIRIVVLRVIHAGNSMKWAAKNGEESEFEYWTNEYDSAVSDYYKIREEQDG